MSFFSIENVSCSNTRSVTQHTAALKNEHCSEYLPELLSDTSECQSNEDVFVLQKEANTNNKDFQVQNYLKDIKPSGCTNPEVLKNAPNPNIKIAGVNKKATYIVDVQNHVLYLYDNNGNAINAYLIATGKASTPTHKGVRVVSHVETYPYKSAPSYSKRRRDPKAFGPKILILDKLDPETGDKSSTGEFIHGNNNPNSLGKNASHGCMRMDNEVIKILAKNAKSGQIVIIK